MRKYVSLAALALLVSGCEKGVEISSFDPAEIRVEALLPESRATLTKFEQGDKMSLYAVEYSGEEVAELQTYGNYLNNEPMVYNGAEWRSERTLYWAQSHCDFYGIYPYQELGAMSDYLFELPIDQSTPETADAISGYEAADIMWAKAEKVSREDGKVNLQFKHMMSRVVVDIVRGKSYEGELPKDIDVHIYNTLTSAIVDWRIGSLKADQQGSRKTIKMRQVDGDTFDAIVVPQFIQRSTPLIEITMEGIAYLLESSASLRPGKQHHFEITLNTSPDQEKIEISVGGSVGGWD